MANFGNYPGHFKTVLILESPGLSWSPALCSHIGNQSIFQSKDSQQLKHVRGKSQLTTFLFLLFKLVKRDSEQLHLHTTGELMVS